MAVSASWVILSYRSSWSTSDLNVWPLNISPFCSVLIFPFLIVLSMLSQLLNFLFHIDSTSICLYTFLLYIKIRKQLLVISNLVLMRMGNFWCFKHYIYIWLSAYIFEYPFSFNIKI